MTDAELDRLDKELEVQVALGVAPEMYEVTVYRINSLGEVFRSCNWLGVQGLSTEHAAARVMYTEEHRNGDLERSADKLHRVDVMGPLNLGRNLRLHAHYPIRTILSVDPDLNCTDIKGIPLEKVCQKKLETLS